MSSGYPGRDFRSTYNTGFGSSLQYPYQSMPNPAVSGGAGLLKRSLNEIERQQQIHHAMFLRSVKQRTLLSNLSDQFSSPASSTSTTTFNSFQENPVPAPQKPTMHSSLLELERQLLEDDDDDETSACGSGVTAVELDESLQQLITPPAPVAAVPSPTTSTSSTTSSTASCSPVSATPSRQLLLDTASAVADGAIDTAAANLAALNRAADRRGDPEQRLTAMMAAALVAKINSRSSHSIVHGDVHQSSDPAMQILFDLCPCFKLALLAANLAILDSTKDSPKLHILDFDVGQGSQHAALITTLAERHRLAGTRPPSIKISVISDATNSNNLNLIGDKIASHAQRMGVALRFNIIKCRISDLNAASINHEPDESLAVNLAFHLSHVADESVSPENPRDELLRRVRALSPTVVVFIEQELIANTSSFLHRFAENCYYYGALLESLDTTAARDNEKRLRVEAAIGLKIVNSVATEGAERMERCEVFGKWRARMGMAGLRPVQLGPAVCEPVRSRLGSLRGNPGFTVKEEAGALLFGWMGRTLTVASAWR